MSNVKQTMQDILDQYAETTFYPYGFVEILLNYEKKLLEKHMHDEEPKYREYEDDLISTGWALFGLTAVILCLVGFIIVEVAF
jgi:hypothetical protein